MIEIETFRRIALSFPETVEEPHFENTSFRVKKKIFAIYDNRNKRACIKLSEIDQDIFSTSNQTIIYPVDNKWGSQGWTLIELNKVNPDLFVDALTTAYCEVAPKKLAYQISPNKRKNDHKKGCLCRQPIVINKPELLPALRHFDGINTAHSYRPFL